MAQSLAAAARTVDRAKAPTSMHLQFLRGGEAGDPVDYRGAARLRRAHRGVAPGRRPPGRTSPDHRDRVVRGRAARARARPPRPCRCGARRRCPGPVRPARPRRCRSTNSTFASPTTGSGQEFVRRLWWRVTVALPDDALLHTVVAVYVTDVYMIDPALQVHGHSMRARTHRSGTTDSSIWFHRQVRADRWNLLECRSPAAARGRAVVTASLIGADGLVAATLVQEGLIAEREPAPAPAG